MIRYAFDTSSNAWLEIQWYLFAAIVMLGASYTLRRNEHVRVDIFYIKLNARPGLARPPRHAVLPAAVMLICVAELAVLHAVVRRRDSTNAGGLIRWPVKLLCRSASLLVALQGVSESHQARRAARHPVESRHALREAGAMITPRMMPPLMFGGLVLFMLIGYPVAFSLAALGLAFGFFAIQLGYFRGLPAGHPGRIFGSILANELLLAIPFFTFMGAILEKCGLAEDMLDSMGQLFGRPRRPRLFGDHRRLHPRRDHRHGRGAGDRDGADLPAGDDALQVQHALRDRRAGGLGHHHAARAAVAGADRAGRPARPLGGRHVPRRLGPVAAADRVVRGLHVLRQRLQAGCLPPVPRTLRGWALLMKCAWGIIPAAVLIFLVLGTILLGLATPTEAGAMGMVGALVLAVIRNPPLTKFDRIVFGSGCVAAVVGAIIGIVAFKSVPFKIAFAVLYCVGRLPVLAGLAVHRTARADRAGLRGDDAPDRDGDLHPDRLDVLLDRVPGRRRRPLARAPAERACPAACGAS